MKWKIASILTMLILFIVLYFLVSENNTNISEEGIITKIIDGDTIVFQGGETIRLLGLDCDERGKECYNNAKERIEELILEKTVILESDGEDKDIYGRSLRYVFLEGENINKKMVLEGYCVARFQDDSKYKKEIQNAESFAILNNVGCKWSEE